MAIEIYHLQVTSYNIQHLLVTSNKFCHLTPGYGYLLPPTYIDIAIYAPTPTPDPYSNAGVRTAKIENTEIKPIAYRNSPANIVAALGRRWKKTRIQL